jgi:hypothetical protein
MAENQNHTIRIPIDGVLDLHPFAPEDAADVVDDYLSACIEKGIYEVKIVHGKGKGILRDKIHASLKRHPLVMNFSLDPGTSGWGATIVLLKKPAGPPGEFMVSSFRKWGVLYKLILSLMIGNCPTSIFPLLGGGQEEGSQ